MIKIQRAEMRIEGGNTYQIKDGEHSFVLRAGNWTIRWLKRQLDELEQRRQSARQGGLATSKAKLEACRENGKQRKRVKKDHLPDWDNDSSIDISVRDRRIYKAYTSTEKTMRDIGEEFNLSQERISQIVERVAEALR